MTARTASLIGAPSDIGASDRGASRDRAHEGRHQQRPGDPPRHTDIPYNSGLAYISNIQSAGGWDAALGEYVLAWDDVRGAADPHAYALEFARSAFRHGCEACAWDPNLAASAEGTPPPVS
jgi:hypothetical protein